MKCHIENSLIHTKVLRHETLRASPPRLEFDKRYHLLCDPLLSIYFHSSDLLSIQLPITNTNSKTSAIKNKKLLNKFFFFMDVGL